jgi:hypothetical protein
MMCIAFVVPTQVGTHGWRCGLYFGRFVPMGPGFRRDDERGS